MADDDADSKTYDPSQHKLDKLRREGSVITSKEVNNLFVLGGIMLLVVFVAPWSLSQAGRIVQDVLASAGTTSLADGAAIGSVLSGLGLRVLTFLLPLLLVMLVIGWLGSVVQNGFLMSSERIQPKLSKISPMAGLKRMFSLNSIAELGKSLFKLLLIGAAITAVIYSYSGILPTLSDADLSTSVTTVQKLLLYVVAAATAVMLFIAGFDYFFQRFQFLKQHRMTAREMKDEYKQTEGDPHVKQRQKQIRMERMRKRMMAAVPKADVIITNPTHYSIALRYKPEEGDDAPVVVAKGVDHVAMRIRELAREHNIPFYEDPPLARSLYAAVEIDQPIPLDLYEAVARVITFVMQLRNRRAA